MSTTHKGSWSRVTDYQSYHSHYDNIFRKPAPVEPPVPEPEEPTEPDTIKPPCSTPTSPT